MFGVLIFIGVVWGLLLIFGGMMLGFGCWKCVCGEV